MTHVDSSHHSSRPQTNGEERFLNTFLARPPPHPPAHLPAEALACASRRVKACAAADTKLDLHHSIQCVLSVCPSVFKPVCDQGFETASLKYLCTCPYLKVFFQTINDICVHITKRQRLQAPRLRLREFYTLEMKLGAGTRLVSPLPVVLGLFGFVCVSVCIYMCILACVRKFMSAYACVPLRGFFKP